MTFKVSITFLFLSVTHLKIEWAASISLNYLLSPSTENKDVPYKLNFCSFSSVATELRFQLLKIEK